MHLMSPTMTAHKIPCNRCEPDLAVSEVIGSVLLISLVVLGVAIVGVLLLSQSGPQKTPNVNFMTGTLTDGGVTKMYLYHNGGDTLAKGTFSVLVDGTARDDYTISDGTNEWSLGQNLILTVPPGPHSVALVYNATGSPVVIRSGTSSGIAVVSTPRPDVRISSGYPPIVSVPQLMQNLSRKSVTFYREKDGYISQSSSTYIKFNITQPNSTIYSLQWSCAAPYKLEPGNTVTITQTNSITQGFRIAGIGSQLRELSADYVDVVVKDSNDAILCSGSNMKINQSLITGYNNFQTNLSLLTGSTNNFTALTIYDYKVNTTPQETSQIINGGSSDSIKIFNISPNDAGFFVFQLDNATKSIYFSGNATKITRNSVTIYPS